MFPSRPFTRALTLLLSAPPLLSAQADEYTITNVSHAVPGFAVGMAGLSDTGFVAGWVIDAGPTFDMKGFRWSPAGTVLPPSPSSVTWVTHAAIDVNDAGTFIGYFGAEVINVLDRGFRTKAGVTEELLSPSGLQSYPYAINDAGWIVGQGAGPVSAPAGAVMWSPDLVPSYVGNLSAAIDINDHNQVVGHIYDENNLLTGYLVEHGKMKRLGTLDPAQEGDVLPWAINNSATVVGYSKIGQDQHAFRWTAASGMSELPGLGFQTPFLNDAAAVDINDAGTIIGYAPGETGQTPVIWAPDGTVTRLDTLIPGVGIEENWNLLAHVMKINAVGQIVAMATHKPSDYQARTVLLTPAELHAEPEADPAGGSMLRVTGAAPGRPVYLVAAADNAFDIGYTPIPGCEPMGICMDDPQPIAVALADGAGDALFHWQLPPSLVGGAVRLQALQLSPCRVSNVVHVAP
jgi:probable HAF family extracellular repeat protein